MSIVDTFLGLHSEFERMTVDVNTIVSRPFDPAEKPMNNTQAIAINFKPTYDPMNVNTRFSLEIYFSIVGFKPTVSKQLSHSYCILCFRLANDVSFDESKQLLAIIANRLQETFNLIKLSRVRIVEYGDGDDKQLIMTSKNKPIYMPFFEAAIWLLGNDQYIKNLCVLEPYVEYGPYNSITHYITIRGIRVSMSHLQQLTGKKDIKIYPL